jgi:4-hydroxy-tetrahydrodipicolinate synthase
MHYELLPLFKAMFIETNPIPIKAAMAMKGMIAESYRLPMCPLAPKSRESLQATLKELKVL